MRRFGGGYEHFVILDGDSVMSGTTLVRLALAMERDQQAGLIQTVPRLTGATTLLQYLTQFASNVYGPLVAAGLAFWHRDQGNYWGHNAIIRTIAFASAAGLPTLPGRAPFGGDIQSHDFVEAVLLARADWGVHMVPTIEGSYEGQPPTLPDVVARDRRWAQGNLQHLGIVFSSGITTMGRLHLLMGATSYLMSLVWASSLVVGIVLALQGQQMIPSYFIDEKTLFPVWPVTDPGAALRLFFATMLVVLMPKFLGLALEIKRTRHAREALGATRAVLGVITETLFSILLSPILMVTQTAAVFQVLFGLDSGWRTQSRDGAGIPFMEALRYHRWHMLIGVVMAAGVLRGVGAGAGLDVAGHRRPDPCRAADLADVARRGAAAAHAAVDARRAQPAGDSSRARAAPRASGPITSPCARSRPRAWSRSRRAPLKVSRARRRLPRSHCGGRLPPACRARAPAAR